MSTARKKKSPSAVRNTSGLRRGGPGRRKGVPNRATVEARALAQRMLGDPAYLANLRKRANAGRLPPAVEVALWAYAWGKPKDHVEVTGPNGQPLEARVVTFYMPDNRRNPVEAT